MSIELPAADVRDDGPLAYRSRGSYRAAALEQLALRLDHLRGLQAARRGARTVTFKYNCVTVRRPRVYIKLSMAIYIVLNLSLIHI